ncbi:MAG: hypothetical protein MHM6MM_007192 [Cercozoa sp. M6MM]
MNIWKDGEGVAAQSVNEYAELWADGQQDGVQRRKTQYEKLVNHYYDLSTDFYEAGWGESFHFAPRHSGETFQASLVRHEHWLASHLGLTPGMVCADLGCGVGGPLRNIARFTGAKIIGINNNAYQVQRAEQLNERAGLSHLSDVVKSDFCDMSAELPDESIDAAYSIEATCHAPDRQSVFAEIYRALKPGGRFVSYEWVTTPLFDADNAEHVRIVRNIEVGDGLPELVSSDNVLQALRDVGFEVELAFDLAKAARGMGNDIPWYSSLQATCRCDMQTLKHSRVGTWITQKLLVIALLAHWLFH